jgi:hypothetical protein
MAGSFGYEEEHYETSMKIGELVLFPTVRQQPEDVIIAALVLVVVIKSRMVQAEPHYTLSKFYGML